MEKKDCGNKCCVKQEQCALVCVGGVGGVN